jgi:hypothetical protein
LFRIIGLIMVVAACLIGCRSFRSERVCSLRIERYSSSDFEIQLYVDTFLMSVIRNVMFADQRMWCVLR